MKHVVPLEKARDDAIFGSKAVGLGQALRDGLPVPPGVALSGSIVDAVAVGDVKLAIGFGVLKPEMIRTLDEDLTPALIIVQATATADRLRELRAHPGHIREIALEGVIVFAGPGTRRQQH